MVKLVTLVTQNPENRIISRVFGVTNRITKLVTGGIKWTIKHCFGGLSE